MYIIYEDNTLHITKHHQYKQHAVLILASCVGMDRITMHRDLTDIFVVDKNIM